MTGITADTARLSEIARLATGTAARLRAGVDPGGGDAVFALPQADRFRTALAAARGRQAESASGLARFYGDAGTALTALGGALTDREDAAARGFRGLDTAGTADTADAAAGGSGGAGTGGAVS